jgi:hypothetical protein
MNLSRQANKIIAPIPGQIFDVPADVESKSPISAAHNLNHNVGYTRSDDTETPCRSLGEIDDTTIGVGSTVIDTYNDIPTVIDACHAHDSPEWQRPVCRGELIHIEPLAARRGTPVKGITVPARFTTLDRAVRRIAHLTGYRTATNDPCTSHRGEKTANQRIGARYVHWSSLGFGC